jgi:DNA-directed RNA polymerase specialized sigma24 family protein
MPLPMDMSETLERQHLVRQALRQLDPQSQDLLFALFLDPQSPSCKKLAARLGIPEDNIGSLLIRLFNTLGTIPEDYTGCSQ